MSRVAEAYNEELENSILYYLPRVAYWVGNKSGMAVYSDVE